MSPPNQGTVVVLREKQKSFFRLPTRRSITSLAIVYVPVFHLKLPLFHEGAPDPINSRLAEFGEPTSDPFSDVRARVVLPSEERVEMCA